jgi:DMSO/TMAO reductase YedYZ molybdopterin-dependent catalytic subunit
VAPPAWLAGVAGLLAGAVAVTVGMLVAASSGVASPIDAVGNAGVDRTPPWLKELAISWFGTSNKLALRTGVVVVLALAALVIGAVSLRHRWYGIAGIVTFGVLGAAAAAERPSEGAAAVVAPLVGTVAGIATLLVLLHALTGRWRAGSTPGPSRVPAGWDRRRFLVTSGAATAVAVTAGALAVRDERQRVRQLEAAIPATLPRLAGGAPPLTVPGGADLVPGTPYLTPNDRFYRIDTALSFPRIDLRSWTVRVHGLVDREVRLTYDDLLALPQVERIVTLCCVSNEVGGRYVGNAVWQGVLLADVLDRAGVRPEAQQVFSRSVDGWTCGFPVEVARDGRDCLIAVGMNGEPLPLAHGFPARLVVPGLYGYVSATKWLAEIELTTWDAREGYWVPRGWAREAPIKTQSRIDVPRSGETVPPGRTVIAGVAWAPHRGIAKVEVRVDDGPWREARLGTDVTDDSWRQWVLEWDATEGEHTVQVRATDGTGETQTEVVSRPDPDGATGWHTRRVTVRPA